MAEKDFRYFEFGEFRLDAYNRVLQKNGETIHLTPRIFDLLYVMVENAGRILEHDELLDKVWEGAFVEQANVKKSISTLRQALGEAPGASEFITTIPRRGYRFTAQVRTLPHEQETVLIRETISEIFVEEEIEDDHQSVITISPPALESKKSGRFQTRQIVFASGMAVFILAVAFTAWIFWRKPPQRFSVETVRTTKLVAEGTAANVVSVSADGKYIVYSIFDKGNSSLMLKQLATGSITTLVPWQSNVAFWGYNFSPDNEYVYYIIHNNTEPSKSGLYKIPFLGGAAQRIAENAGGYLTFSPDGKRLAFTRGLENFYLELVTVNSDGGDERRVAIYDESYRIWGVVWTADGDALLCTIRKQKDDKMVYYVAEVSVTDGKEKIILPEQTTNIISAVWLPDKQSLLFSMSEPNAVIRQIWQYFPATGERHRVTNDNVSYWFLSLTRDGKTLVTTQETRPAAIWLAENNSTDFRQITVGANEFERAFWAADGRIVYQTVENRQEAIWTMNIDGSQKQRITSGNDSYELRPLISADGRTITFASRRSGSSQVWSVDIDGRNLRQLTDDLKTPTTEAKLLADGQSLIYTSYVSPFGWTLFKRTPDKKETQLTQVTIEAWDVSPDEKLLAYSGTDRETKKYKIYVQSLGSGEIIKTFDDRASHVLRWTRDGRAIIFGSRRDGSSSEIIIQPIDGGTPKIFNSNESDRVIGLDWSLDGKNLLVVRGRIQGDVVLIQADSEHKD